MSEQITADPPISDSSVEKSPGALPLVFEELPEGLTNDLKGDWNIPPAKGEVQDTPARNLWFLISKLRNALFDGDDQLQMEAGRILQYLRQYAEEKEDTKEEADRHNAVFDVFEDQDDKRNARRNVLSLWNGGGRGAYERFRDAKKAGEAETEAGGGSPEGEGVKYPEALKEIQEARDRAQQETGLDWQLIRRVEGNFDHAKEYIDKKSKYFAEFAGSAETLGLSSDRANSLGLVSRKLGRILEHHSFTKLASKLGEVPMRPELTGLPVAELNSLDKDAVADCVTTQKEKYATAVEGYRAVRKELVDQMNSILKNLTGVAADLDRMVSNAQSEKEREILSRLSHEYEGGLNALFRITRIEVSPGTKIDYSSDSVEISGVTYASDPAAHETVARVIQPGYQGDSEMVKPGEMAITLQPILVEGYSNSIKPD